MAKLGEVILRDTTVNRPTAGIEGRLFADTTTGSLERDNGASWDSISTTAGGTVGGTGTANTLAKFSAASTLADSQITDDGSLITLPGDVNLSGRTPESILRVDADGNIAEVTVGAGLSFDGTELTATGSGGTVTSVALSAPSEFSVGGSPVTTTGTLALSWANESANRVLIGPTSGGAATPTFRALTAADLPSNFLDSTINFVIDGGGSVPSTGAKGVIVVDFACTILSATLLADQSGSAVVDVKKATYSGFPTVSSICASAKPTLSAAQKSQDATLTGWTTSISAGDTLTYNLDSVTTCTRLTLALKVRRT